MRPLLRLSDRLVAGGFIRPAVLIRGLQLSRPSLSRWPVILTLSLSGLAVEPLAWLQSLLYRKKLAGLKLPDDPIVVIGHWRSGTTYMHQLLACDPAMATARNTFTVAPQVALLLKPVLRPLLKRWMSQVRPIDAVPWGADDPQEDELGLARLTMDTNMAGLAFPLDYLFHLRRSVTGLTPGFERQWLHLTRLTWLHDGRGKTRLLIKNSAHSARLPLLIKHFPRARFVLLQRSPIDSIRSLVQVKQRLGDLVGLQPPPSLFRQVEETAIAHAELMQSLEQSQHCIPAEQLLKLSYGDLVTRPLETVKRIYDHFGIVGWSEAEGPIRQRVARARAYKADPVHLPEHLEQHLRDCLKTA